MSTDQQSSANATWTWRAGTFRLCFFFCCLITVPGCQDDFSPTSLGGSGPGLLGLGVPGGRCDPVGQQQHHGAQTRGHELQRDKLDPQWGWKQHQGAVHRAQRGQLHDPAGPVRPDRHHYDRSPLLPHPSCAAEEASPEEEVRSAVQLRRLGGNGRDGE